MPDKEGNWVFLNE
jgi:hypothetical protein